MYNASLPENSLELNLTVAAIDRDGSTQYSILNYSISPPEFNRNFSISEKGEISTLQPFDFETDAHDVRFMVIAEDSGGLSAVASVHIQIEDQNDHQPEFEQATYSILIPEDTEVSSTVLEVLARDGDASIQYGTIDGYAIRETANYSQFPFLVDLNTGEITLIAPLDFETNQTTIYHFTVVATDTGAPQPQTGEASITIAVGNVNDNSPWSSGSDPQCLNT